MTACSDETAWTARAERAGGSEVTDEMVDAAEAAMWDHARNHNIVTLDEMHRETFRAMLVAALRARRA